MNGTCHRYERVVAFPDTDASGWVHFTKILAYAEEAEHSYLRQCGLPVFDPAKGGWPRVKVSCEYRKPLRFEDRIEVRLALSRMGGTSVTWNFEIAKMDGEIAARGEMTAVKVNAAGLPETIPGEERKLLEGGK
ncbi:acyl-CoA thioesterase [Akkermansiaceae bacterium]|nr:acyl-CoA thioesterase [Akkermansiaceae bacterium]